MVFLGSIMNSCDTKVTYDVVVIGGSSSGTSASIQSARSGAKTLLISENQWLGGMLTSAGVACVDGNYDLPSGFFGEFRDSLVQHYGDAKALQTGWVSHVNFEPVVGEQILSGIAGNEENLTIVHDANSFQVKRENDKWFVTYNQGEKTHVVEAKILVDATELGDIAAGLGISYDLGMDSRAVSGESIAPEKANNVIQDLTYVLILKDYGKDMTIEQPKNYDPSYFYCATESEKCTEPKPNQKQWPINSMITYGKLPNGKYMINWPIEGNDYYANIVELSPEERTKKLQEAKDFSLAYLYYMQTELGLSHLGLDDETFPTEDKLPFIPYHRESRRIHGEVRFSVNDIAKPYDQEEALYRTNIAVGDYPIDHHHYRYPNWQELPELHFFPVPSYGLPMGVLLPKQNDYLIVAEKSISVTNIVNGTTRLQPVVLQIGQAAGAIAANAAMNNKSTKAVDIREIQSELLNRGGYIMPYLDVKKEHERFQTYQKIGATGLIRGIGMNIGWKNQTWLKTDSVMTFHEMNQGIEDYLGQPISDNTSDQELSIQEAIKGTQQLAEAMNISLSASSVEKLFEQSQAQNIFDKEAKLEQTITRGDYAALLSYWVDPFNKQKVNIKGDYIKKNENSK